MVNWKEKNSPFKKFTEELTQEWINCGFNKKETRKWLESDLEPSDARFAQWLRNIKGKNREWLLDEGDKDELIKEYNYEAKEKIQTSDVQKYLESKFSRENRKEVKKIDLSNKGLVGNLDLSEFKNLEEINVSGNPQLGEVINKSWRTAIRINAQEWLDKTYSNKQEIKEIKVGYKNKEKLDGELAFSNFPLLEKAEVSFQRDLTKIKVKNCPRLSGLNCGENKITCLEIIECPQLEKVSCQNNQIGELNIKGCPQLDELRCYGNRISKDNLENIIETYPHLKRDNLWKTSLFQEWLEWHYPKKERSEVKKIDLDSYQLKGSADFSEFSDLEELNINFNNITTLNLTNLNKLKSLDCRENKFVFLDLTFCPNLKELDCAYNKLTNLDLSKCSELEILTASDNELTKLDLSNLVNLESVDCFKNQLTSLDFLQDLASEKLEMFNVSGNNLEESNLIPFQNFTNLQHLGLGNWYKETINQGIYNRFIGSLEPLTNINQLEELDLAGTDVDSGWEYLPESLQTLYLVSKERPESQVQIIAEQLRNYGETAKDRHEDDNFATLLTKYKTTKKIQELEGEKEQFIEQQKEISYLELRVNELTNLVNTQKEKIINTFLRLFPERDLLQELITKHLELTKFKKQALGSANYRKQCRQYENDCHKLEDEIEESLLENDSNEEKVEEKMNNIKSILTDCEELVIQELELEQKLTNKSRLIENQRQNSLLQLTSEQLINQITQYRKELVEKENTNQKQLQEFYLQQQETLVNKITEVIEERINTNQDTLTKLINQLLTKEILLEEKQNIINKINNLLGIKRMFLNARQQTITKLQATCDLLEEANIGKYAKIEEASKALAATGKLVANWVPVNIIEPIGDGTSVFNSHNKRKFAMKNGQVFQQFLTEEEKNLGEFKKVYNSLINSLPNLDKDEEPNLFTIRYRIYDIATNIWQNKAHVETSDMKDAISALQINLLNLQDELQKQKTLLSNLQKQQLQAQIQVAP